MKMKFLLVHHKFLHGVWEWRDWMMWNYMHGTWTWASLSLKIHAARWRSCLTLIHGVCINRLWGPRFATRIQHMKQFAHNRNLPCCQCTDICPHVFSIESNEMCRTLIITVPKDLWLTYQCYCVIQSCWGHSVFKKMFVSQKKPDLFFQNTSRAFAVLSLLHMSFLTHWGRDKICRRHFKTRFLQWKLL